MSGVHAPNMRRNKIKEFLEQHYRCECTIFEVEEEKGCGMMWTLKHLKQDRVLFMEDECSIQAAVSVIEFNYRVRNSFCFGFLISQAYLVSFDLGLASVEAFDETSQNLADART
ncbi:hypothetical protein KY284_030050 [Solanum tuberosum]|nr:hypothetical protein KY284_030050 [Solanum tuberosum]